MAWPSENTPQPAQLTNIERDNLIVTWRRSVDELKIVKDREMTQRTAVAQALFPTPKKGTQRYDLGSGYAVKLVYKLNYRLGDPDATNQDGDKVPVNDQVDALLTEIEKLGNEGAFLADRLVKWKAELSVSEYQKLDDSNPTHKAIKKLIDGILTVEPAAPSLELEEPKPK